MGWFENFNADQADRVLSVIAKIMNIAFLVFVSFGVLIVVFYSAIRDHSLEGVSFGDGFLFAVVAIWFLIIYFIFVMVMLGTSILAGWVFFIYRREGQVSLVTYSARAGLAPLLSCAFLAFYFIVGLILNGEYEGALRIIAVIMGHAALYRALFYFNRIERERYIGQERLVFYRKIKISIVFFILVMPFLITKYKKDLIFKAVEMAGVRSGEYAVMFKDEYKKFIVSSGVEDRPVYKVLVVTRGLGSSSTLELCGQRFVVPNEQFFYSKGAEENLKLNSACIKAKQIDEEP